MGGRGLVHNSVHSKEAITEVQASDDGGLDQGGDSRDGESGLLEIHFESIMERLDDGLDLGHEENG